MNKKAFCHFCVARLPLEAPKSNVTVQILKSTITQHYHTVYKYLKTKTSKKALSIILYYRPIHCNIKFNSTKLVLLDANSSCGGSVRQTRRGMIIIWYRIRICDEYKKQKKNLNDYSTWTVLTTGVFIFRFRHCLRTFAQTGSFRKKIN